uniref:Uncharacterized protein n=1 Tax=Arundo donax TaxID=35708 RepID=A0A0A9C7K9_ARUDO
MQTECRSGSDPLYK